MKIIKESKRLDKEKILIFISFWSSYVPNGKSFAFIKNKVPLECGYICYYLPKEVLVPNVDLTKKRFNLFISKVLKDLMLLKKIKNRRFRIYGQSLGGLFAMIISDKIDIDKAFLICPGDNLAESFWNGIVTRKLRVAMQKHGVSLEKLKKQWKKISPDFYFKDKSKKTNFYIILSKNDKVIPYKNGRGLINLLKKKRIKFEVNKSGLSHELSLFNHGVLSKESLKFLVE